VDTLTARIIGCAMKVHRELGAGFIEKVYERALVHELRKAGLFVEQQVPFQILYDNINVGNYRPDTVVERKVILELKALSANIHPFIAICCNYLKASKLPVCLLINFGKPSLEWKRVVGETYDESNPI
jgi:GxxExxY protein